VRNKKVTEEELTKTMAKALNIPYVNLSTADISIDVLKLLPRETAERFMAVPLGEMQNRLVVAMLDADNIQAQDYLSKKIGRPIKVYMASENGIREIIGQMKADLEGGVAEVIAESGGDELAKGLEGVTKDIAGDKEAKAKQKAKDIEASVNDSPISRALSTILESNGTGNFEGCL